MRNEVNTDTINDVNHLVTFSSPNEIPFITMKNTETNENINDKT